MDELLSDSQQKARVTGILEISFILSEASFVCLLQLVSIAFFLMKLKDKACGVAWARE